MKTIFNKKAVEFEVNTLVILIIVIVVLVVTIIFWQVATGKHFFPALMDWLKNSFGSGIKLPEAA